MPIDAVIALFLKHPTLTSLKVFQFVVLEGASYILEYILIKNIKINRLWQIIFQGTNI